MLMPELNTPPSCLDASCIISLLLGSPDDHAEATRRLLQRRAASKDKLLLFTSSVLDAAVILEEEHLVPRSMVATTLLALVQHSGVRVESPDLIRTTLAVANAHDVPFRAAFIAVQMQQAECTMLYATTQDYKGIAGIRCHPPD